MRSLPPRPAVVPVVCGIIERGNRFLAALRGNTRQNAGRWEFPGGKIHAGEPAEKALVRELREELCLDISITAGLPPGLYTFDGMTIELKPFVCSPLCGEPRLCEHAAIRWVTVDEAKTLEWTPADVTVFKQYQLFKKCPRPSCFRSL